MRYPRVLGLLAEIIQMRGVTSRLCTAITFENQRRARVSENELKVPACSGVRCIDNSMWMPPVTSDIEWDVALGLASRNLSGIAPPPDSDDSVPGMSVNRHP